MQNISEAYIAGTEEFYGVYSENYIYNGNKGLLIMEFNDDNCICDVRFVMTNKIVSDFWDGYNTLMEIKLDERSDLPTLYLDNTQSTKEKINNYFSFVDYGKSKYYVAASPFRVFDTDYSYSITFSSDIKYYNLFYDSIKSSLVDKNIIANAKSCYNRLTLFFNYAEL